MHSIFIPQLLTLGWVKVTKILQGDSFVKIYITTAPREHNCPACGTKTSKLHDYREQTIKDLPFQFKHTYLVQNLLSGLKMQKALGYQSLRNVHLHIEDGLKKLKMLLNMVIQISFELQNFHRFRNRILHCTS